MKRRDRQLQTTSIIPKGRREGQYEITKMFLADSVNELERVYSDWYDWRYGGTRKQDRKTISTGCELKGVELNNVKRLAQHAIEQADITCSRDKSRCHSFGYREDEAAPDGQYGEHAMEK